MARPTGAFGTFRDPKALLVADEPPIY